MDAREQLDRLVREYFDFEHRAHPVDATFRGIHDYDHLLGRFDAASLAEEFEQTKAFQRRLSAIVREDLDLYRRNDCLLLESKFAAEQINFEEMRWHQNNPAAYVEICLYGLFILILRQFAPLEVRIESLVGRLRDIPRVLAEARANLKNPPEVFTSVALEMVQGGRQLFQALIPDLARKVPQQEKDILLAAAEAQAAFQELQAFLEQDLLPRSNGQFAIGEELFDQKLSREHLLSYTAADLYHIGQDHLQRAQEQLARLSKTIDPHRSWPEVIEILKGDHPSREGLLDEYRQAMERSKDFVHRRDLADFPPGEVLEIISTPKFQQSTIPYAAYLPPAPYEQDQRGFFYVTPINQSFDVRRQEEQLRGHCRHKIPITALHEGYPGHHLQLAWSNRVPSRVRRECGLSTVFAEGWALYCEEMMRQEGFYDDPRVQLFGLKDHVWRCARVVLDVALHARGMQVPEAVEYLVHQAGLEKTNALAEVRRYTMQPTQPMSYLIGQLEILRMKDRYRHRKGDAFRPKEFHNRLLRVGTVPLRIAEQELSS